MKTLNHSTSEINRNFRIKVSGNGLNTLLGVSGATELIGAAMFNSLLDRAFSSTGDVCVCRLRRGLKVSFYNK